MRKEKKRQEEKEEKEEEIEVIKWSRIRSKRRTWNRRK